MELMEQILKKEDKLRFKGGFLKNKMGSLVLTPTNLYFVTKKGTRVFDVSVKNIQSVNCKKGFSSVDQLFVICQENEKETTLRIEHVGSVNILTLGPLARLSMYFSSWEQMINDARFGRSGTSGDGFNDLEKLAELKSKGVITEEEFAAKKKQLLGI